MKISIKVKVELFYYKFAGNEDNYHYITNTCLFSMRWKTLSRDAGVRYRKFSVCVNRLNRFIPAGSRLQDVKTAEFPVLPEKMQEKRDFGYLDEIINRIYENNRCSWAEVSTKVEALRVLESFLREKIDDSIRLELYGSSRNGFSFRGSDMDICLFFKNFENSPPEEFSDPVEVLENVSKILESNESILFVSAISDAIVPIVTFEFVYQDMLFQGDISFYKMLARRNTKLINAYSQIDERFLKLGFLLKGKIRKLSIFALPFGEANE